MAFKKKVFVLGLVILALERYNNIFSVLIRQQNMQLSEVAKIGEGGE